MTSRDGAVETGLGAALAAWASLPSLAAALRDPDGTYLVLDAADGRVLHAPPAARALEAALRDADRADIARQIAGAAAASAPRLARLRLDPRRIAPPSLCLLAGGTREDGLPLVLLVPAGPLALPRPRPGRAAESADPPPAPAAASLPAPDAPPDAPPSAGDRFLWRSDADGTLVSVTGAGEGLARLVGRDWRGLAESGGLAGAESVLDSLDARRTFRALPASLDLGRSSVEVELSGAPLGRGAAAFAGFGGFGLVRRVLSPPTVPVPDAAVPEPAEATPPAGGDLTDTPPPEEEVSSSAAPAAAASPAPAAPPPAEPAPVPVPADPSLSVSEHDAFREIARALGARYAGDEEAAAAGDADAMRPTGGAVMPFPGAHAERPEAPAQGRTAPLRDDDVLGGLPVPALVHRGDAILAANRPLLELAGFDGLGALRAAGLGRLLRGLASGDRAETGGGRRTVIEMADGRARPVEATGGPCTWEGEPAVCLVLRALEEDDPAQALAAERLARQAQAARACTVEAALDALDAAVVTLDGAGRVVALNRAATALFDGEARELVGGDFAGLLDPESAASVAPALRGVGECPRTVTVRGRGAALALAPARTDGHRVAVLHAAPGASPAAAEPSADPAQPPARPVDDRSAILGRLEREVRAPMSGIVELTGAMLREPFGALGDTRYRDCLADIKATGERMLERIAELLDLAAVEAGTLDLKPRPLALNEIVAGCVARMQPEAVRGRIVLRTSFSADLADPEADEPSVSRAACLVIEHAIRRAMAGGQVIVSTGPTEDAEVALRVRGTAAATAPEAGAAEHGFALPRALIEANGGRLRLSHRAEEGTLVEITFPTRRAMSA